MAYKIPPRLNISTSLTEGFYSVTSSAFPPHVFSLLALLVHTEQKKSSNKMPNHRYLIPGTLTFSSSYLMVVFICQTNVRNTIPQAQSLWPLPGSPPCLPSLPLDCERRSSKRDVCNTAAIGQTVIQERTHSSPES